MAASHTNLTAAQINRLARRLSEKPLGRSASATTAVERLQRLLAVRIGAKRAATSAKVILGAPVFETAEGRLVAEIECDDDEAGVRTITSERATEPSLGPIAAIEAVKPQSLEPVATKSAPRRRKDADLDACARQSAPG